MKRISLFTILFITFLTPCFGQDSYIIPWCNTTIGSKDFVGGKFKLSLPKGAIVSKGKDIDYSNYSIGYGKKKKYESVFPELMTILIRE